MAKAMSYGKCFAGLKSRAFTGMREARGSSSGRMGGCVPSMGAGHGPPRRMPLRRQCLRRLQTRCSGDWNPFRKPIWRARQVRQGLKPLNYEGFLGTAPSAAFGTSFAVPSCRRADRQKAMAKAMSYGKCFAGLKSRASTEMREARSRSQGAPRFHRSAEHVNGARTPPLA